MIRSIERIALKLRGLDLDELEREWREMDEAREKRQRETEAVKNKARREYAKIRMNRGRS